MAAFNSGGGSTISAHWVKPRYEGPRVAKDPVNHGCPRSHVTVSAPSAISSTKGVKTPPDPNVPRTLWNTTWYPRAAYTAPYKFESGNVRPYGVRTSKVPAGASVSGR